MNKLSPESLWDKFKRRSMHSSYATRNCHDLQIPRLNAEHTKQGFKYSTPKIWNDAPVQGVPEKLCPVCLKIATKQQKFLTNLFHDVGLQMFN